MKENEKCPECGERTLEEHGTSGERHWWFCRTCGAVIDEEGEG